MIHVGQLWCKSWTRKKYHPGQEWKLQKGSKAAYVEYWYSIKLQDDANIKRSKAITWAQYKKEIKEGASVLDYTFKANFTPVFNASQINGIPPFEVQKIMWNYPIL